MANPHETAIDLLRRAHAELMRGRGESGEENFTPGKGEARMAAEQAHSGGHGNVKSAEPQGMGKNAPDDRVPDIQEGSEPTVLKGTGPVPSRGHEYSALAGPAARSGELGDIRRQAALKELEKERSSEGNKESVARAPEPHGEGRVGEVKAPAKAPADENKKAEFEGVPPFAKEPLGGDGWGKARVKVKEMYAARK